METKYSNPGTVVGESVWQIEDQFTALPGNKDLYLKSMTDRDQYTEKYVFSINKSLTDEIVGHAIATILGLKTVSVEFKLYEEEISMVCKIKDTSCEID